MAVTKPWRRAAALWETSEDVCEEWAAQDDGSFKRVYLPDEDLPALRDVAMGLDVLKMPSAAVGQELPLQSSSEAPWATNAAQSSDGTREAAAPSKDMDIMRVEARKQLRSEGVPLPTEPSKRPRTVLGSVGKT